MKALLADAAYASFLVSHEQRAKLMQFEHLERLLTRFESDGSPPPPWVFFTDDDDIWSESRHALYLDACKDADASTSRNTTAVVSTRKARPAKGGGGYDEKLTNAPAVRRLLASGAIQLTDLAEHRASGDNFHMDEYFDYAVRFPLFQRFFRHAAPPSVIRHKLCDLAFVNGYLRVEERDGRLKRFTPAAADEFVYFYGRREDAFYSLKPSSGASTGVEIGAAEAQLAKSGLAEAQAALGSGGGGSGGRDESTTAATVDTGHIAFLLAALRQAIEQELVVMRVITHSVAALGDVLDRACRRHVELLLNDQPAKWLRAMHAPSANAEARARFHEWCYRTARGPIINSLVSGLGFK